MAATPNTVTGATNTSVSAALTGLATNTPYHFRIKAVNSGGTTYGLDQTFTTNCTEPSASTNASTSINISTATLNGTVNANNFSTTVSFEYGTTISYGNSIAATPITVTGATNTSVSAALTGLATSTLYHFRVKAVNCGGIIYGNDKSFTTLCSAPTATTTTATSGSNTATLNGLVNANNGSTVVTFEYGLTTSYGKSITATPSPVTGTNSTSVSAIIYVSGSSPYGIEYHYRIKAVNCGGTSYGGDRNFLQGKK
jgi:phosphodiesterase/alkaline phosphatase D-like protein